MKIQMTDPKGVTLLTAGKKLDENIEVVPSFSTATRKLTVYLSRHFAESNGYVLIVNGERILSSQTISVPVGAPITAIGNTSELTVDCPGFTGVVEYGVSTTGTGEGARCDVVTCFMPDVDATIMLIDI